MPSDRPIWKAFAFSFASLRKIPNLRSGSVSPTSPDCSASAACSIVVFLNDAMSEASRVSDLLNDICLRSPNSIELASVPNELEYCRASRRDCPNDSTLLSAHARIALALRPNTASVAVTCSWSADAAATDSLANWPTL